MLNIVKAQWPALVALAGLVCWTSLAVAQEETEGGEVRSAQTTVTVDESKCCPLGRALSFDITYTLVSDYVWRGFNLSEYATEGREKPNHQLEVAANVDLGQLWGQDPGTCGTLTMGTWFEWFGAQHELDPDKGAHNCQEIDYDLSWAYDIADLATEFTLGYVFWTFPNAKIANTQEWYFSLEHNDAWMWDWLWPGNEEGILNPTFTFYEDVALGAGKAMWMEVGLSHEFEICPKLAVTPSWTLGIDHNYHHYFAGEPESTTRLATMVWGLDATYDITELVRFPEDVGSVSLSGFLQFSDALGNPEDDGIIQDEFYGGMSVGFSF
ncbi:MAG: hypothetical protein KJ749_08060 [Planctomycetes bacterium]|nr:hypothetical protein [Planctomycetota bacterium]